MPVKRPFSDINIEEKVALVKETDSMLAGEKIVNRNVSYRDTVVETFYFNSLGSEIRTVVPGYASGFRNCEGERGGDAAVLEELRGGNAGLGNG